MEINGVVGRLYKGMEWISKLVYIQFLWVLGTFSGLIIGGLFPSTLAMYTLLRKMIIQKEEFSFSKTYWQSFRREFWKSNLLGVLVGIMGFILYFYLVLLKDQEGILFTVLYILLLSLTFTMIITILFLAPVVVHYKLPTLQYVKLSFLLTISYPFHGLSMMGGLVAFYFIFSYVPGLIPFLSFSVLAWFLMFMANLAFEKNKQEVTENLSL
ncbi:putative membrane protein YesL [Bacillus pakistanensis]|uniref:Membrane protein YesL n=1 Tax=Rossellomorea pakistanensis TaxID=992288 RepID=A0ABS2NCH6_9BACI|nr:DUF624 domain-containing protein [Bacillus pakistanensis]MBM7585546.1 putative membrane protein YesL [Bacillus pakistanensis]